MFGDGTATATIDSRSMISIAESAAFDFLFYADWFWDGDNIVICAEADHVTWHLNYNVQLGVAMHVRYLGI
jgi:hypothetical protein